MWAEKLLNESFSTHITFSKLEDHSVIERKTRGITHDFRYKKPYK